MTEEKEECLELGITLLPDFSLHYLPCDLPTEYPIGSPTSPLLYPTHARAHTHTHTDTHTYTHRYANTLYTGHLGSQTLQLTSNSASADLCQAVLISLSE